MPYRKTLFNTGYYYHIFNRSVNKISIFSPQNSFARIIEALDYFRFENTPFTFSKYYKLQEKERNKILANLQKKAEFLVEIVAFCIMSNHFHLLLKQLKKNGIRTYTSNLQNSYAKYYNLKYQREGALFQGRFKVVFVEGDDQLLHLSRYIHLNPHSSGIIKNLNDLINYPWTSLPQYLRVNKGFCHPNIVLDQFKDSTSYKKFVFNQADYQKQLENIKHLILD